MSAVAACHIGLNTPGGRVRTIGIISGCGHRWRSRVVYNSVRFNCFTASAFLCNQQGVLAGAEVVDVMTCSYQRRGKDIVTLIPGKIEQTNGVASVYLGAQPAIGVLTIGILILQNNGCRYRPWHQADVDSDGI